MIGFAELTPQTRYSAAWPRPWPRSPSKHQQPAFTPHLNAQEYSVIVINAAKAKVSGAKLTGKHYTRYTGYPGGLRTRSLQVAQDIDPTFPLMNAVKGMLQHNTLGADMLTRLRIYAGAEHGHQAQRPKAITFDSRGDIKLGWAPFFGEPDAVRTRSPACAFSLAKGGS